MRRWFVRMQAYVIEPVLRPVLMQRSTDGKWLNWPSTPPRKRRRITKAAAGWLWPGWTIRTVRNAGRTR